jgi:hypothetical protein
VPVTLHDPVARLGDGRLLIQIEAGSPRDDLPPATVSFEVEPGDGAVDDASVLPLVPAALVLACRLGQDLYVAEPLPPAIHRAARRVAGLLQRWYGWRPAELVAPLGSQPVRPAWARRRGGVGVFFTRGVDSWGTVLDRRDGPRHARPTHLITLDNEVHIPQPVRDAQLEDTRDAADRLGLPLVVVRTDVRGWLDPHTDWGTQTHGSVLAGIGFLLRSTLREVVISPTHWTPLLRPWGSHPDLDPAWSLPDLRVTHHPGDEMRWKRVERVLQNPIAADTLLVCWQGTGRRNCGRCEKCLRLLTSIELLGATDRLAERFDVPFDPEAITRDLVVSPHPWCDTIDHLDRVGSPADPLRQRWEQVRVEGRPAMWFQTRPRQPRLAVGAAPSVAGPVAGPDAAAGVAALQRRLAAIGLRIDHERPAGGADLVVERAGSGWAVRVAGGPPVLVAELRMGHLDPLIDTLALDRSQIQPYRPDGQDPPPVVPEPPGWAPEPGDAVRPRR